MRTTAILDSPNSSLYITALARSFRSNERLKRAQVAQLVEHCTENAGVGGSIPPLGTKILQRLDLTIEWRPAVQKWDTLVSHL